MVTSVYFLVETEPIFIPYRAEKAKWEGVSYLQEIAYSSYGIYLDGLWFNWMFSFTINIHSHSTPIGTV